MKRIAETFDRLKARNEAALVGFVTAGDPHPETSFQIISAMCREGLDILELGVPFSDPTADGPVIQQSSRRALAHGVTLADVLALSARLRTAFSLPIILFSYYNPILVFGRRKFIEAADAAGVDGVLVVDLPFEESGELAVANERGALALIQLIAPTTPVERMARITASAAGFLYLVSKTGVTGSDGLEVGGIRQQAARLRTATSLPICVGFGISTFQEVAAVAAVADGVVIGSAFERTIAAHASDPRLPQKLGEQVRTLKQATRLPSPRIAAD